MIAYVLLSREIDVSLLVSVVGHIDKHAPSRHDNEMDITCQSGRIRVVSATQYQLRQVDLM